MMPRARSSPPRRLDPARPTFEAILARFIGEIQQVPPRFSAIKVDGNRAYDLARSGEEVVLEARTVVIEELRLIDMPDADTAVLEAECGKGTYVRAIARDMGRLLSCHGHVIALRRTRVGPFDEATGVSISELEAAAKAGEAALAALLLPLEAALDSLLGLPVGPGDAASLARGQSVLVRGRDAPVMRGRGVCALQGPRPGARRAGEGRLPTDPSVQFRLKMATLGTK